MEQTLLFILTLTVAFLCIAIIFLALKINKALSVQPNKQAPISFIEEKDDTKIKAAIVASIMAYYNTDATKQQTNFVVRRIKRLY